MNLFQQGDFVLHSGARSSFKLECDALTYDDWVGVAAMIAQIERNAGRPFSRVIGVPNGGIKLAVHLQKYATPCGDYFSKVTDYKPYETVLIVDDVLTTGKSMESFRRDIAKVDEEHKIELERHSFDGKCWYHGFVLFARGPCPSWIKAVCQIPKELSIS